MHLAIDISLRQGAFTLEAKLDCRNSALGIFGPSGSGKSTLIRAIAGLKEQILPFLARVHRELHLPCILVSHYLPEILQLTNRLVLMKNGKICGQGSLDGLVAQRDTFEMMRRSGLMSTVTLMVDGEPLKAGVRPDEVMLANRPVEGLSASHRKQGTIARLIDHSSTILCLIDIGEERLMADITPVAVRELGLKEGSPVWCFIKAGGFLPLASNQIVL
jgi:molybdate transport system ATP-binding protein